MLEIKDLVVNYGAINALHEVLIGRINWSSPSCCGPQDGT